MSRRQPVFTMFTGLWLGVMGLGTEIKGPWQLHEVLRLAAERVDLEDTTVRNARLELEVLEALNRTRVEFRPQLNILSFSNPLFLAASLGGGFSVNRRTAPSPLNMELARFRVVEAELVQARRRINAQTEAARYFFALAEAEDLARRSCDSWDRRNRDRGNIQTLVSLNRMTRLDMIRFEQDLTGLEGECIGAKAQAQTSASGLVRRIGLEIPAEQVEITTEDLGQVHTSEILPALTDLVKAAMESHKDFKVLERHITDLSDPEAPRRIQFESLSTGYSYLKNVQKQSPDISKQYLLGGNVGHLLLTFSVPLRKTGEAQAATAFLQSRLDGLKQDFDDLKLAVRHEIEDSNRQAKLAAARLELAQKKQRLADELHTLTAQRSLAGLQGTGDELWTRRDAMRAEAEFARVELEWKRNISMLLALCEPQKLANLPRPSGPRKPNQVKTDVSLGPQLRPISLYQRNPSRQILEVNRVLSLPVSQGYRMAYEKHDAGPVVLARPLKQVTPTTRIFGSSMIFVPAEIGVRIRIDQNGRVATASAVNNGFKSNAFLTAQAIRAAQKWIFEPARIRDKSIPSDYTIVFNFRPRTQ